MKTCIKCLLVKEYTEFHKGHNQCIECYKKHKKEYSLRPETIKHAEEYYSRQEVIKHKKEKRDERYANPDLKKIYKSRRKERYANPEIKERIIKSRKKYNSKPETKKLTKERYTKDEYSKISNILKNDAKEFIRKLIYEKKIKKQSECECFLCNKSSKESRIYYHHPDYNEFSKVIPLCAACHSEVHSFMKIIYPKEIFEGIEIPEKYKNKIIFL